MEDIFDVFSVFFQPPEAHLQIWISKIKQFVFVLLLHEGKEPLTQQMSIGRGQKSQVFSSDTVLQ